MGLLDILVVLLYLAAIVALGVLGGPARAGRRELRRTCQRIFSRRQPSQMARHRPRSLRHEHFDRAARWPRRGRLHLRLSDGQLRIARRLHAGHPRRLLRSVLHSLSRRHASRFSGEAVRAPGPRHRRRPLGLLGNLHPHRLLALHRSRRTQRHLRRRAFEDRSASWRSPRSPVATRFSADSPPSSRPNRFSPLSCSPERS